MIASNIPRNASPSSRSLGLVETESDVGSKSVRQLTIFILLLLAYSGLAEGAIHSAPVVVQGYRIKSVTHYPVAMYRLFRSAKDGRAVTIPFQIDEINEWGDYVLPQGGKVTANTGNGIFDLQDELSFMGDDVGPVKTPTKWPEGKKPALTYEIRLDFRGGKNQSGDNSGAVYLGIFFKNPPKISDRRYVFFKRSTAEVVTSRYRYGFDQKNWLVSRQVEMLSRATKPKPKFVSLLESTTFYMKADLKYFLTITANHRSIESELEAYKIGPIRTIVRVSFHYKFLKLNFELGMYTEVSFFSNAVYLPAILYNPLDGQKSLNSGSGFYYGMALKENPNSFKISTNMPPYSEAGFLDFFKAKKKTEELYWVMASGKDRMLYMEISPSKEMQKAGAIPMMYRENIPGPRIRSRGDDDANPLGESPVNLGLYFDMTKFSEGEHTMAFRLFFENVNDEKKLAAFKSLAKWNIGARRLKK